MATRWLTRKFFRPAIEDSLVINIILRLSALADVVLFLQSPLLKLAGWNNI